jgi:hypothetical protein
LWRPGISNLQFLIKKKHAKINVRLQFFSSVFGIKILDPDPDSLEMLDLDPDPQLCYFVSQAGWKKLQ